MISTENKEFFGTELTISLKPEQIFATPVYGDDGEEIYKAGQYVKAGCYIEIDRMTQVYLENPGILPASLDGRRAYYRRLERPWVQFFANKVDSAVAV